MKKKNFGRTEVRYWIKLWDLKNNATSGETVPLNTIKTLLDHKENMYSLFLFSKMC
jgi:hypothetical protein